MSERERWVVYPLLFLTLGVALRDKMLKRVDADVMEAKQIDAPDVVCERVVIVSAGSRQIRGMIADAPESGRLAAYDAQGNFRGFLGGQSTARVWRLPEWLLPQRPAAPRTGPQKRPGPGATTPSQTPEPGSSPHTPAGSTNE